MPLMMMTMMMMMIAMAALMKMRMATVSIASYPCSTGAAEMVMVRMMMATTMKDHTDA